MAFKTKEGCQVVKYDEWQTNFSKIDGFLFHEHRFYAYSIGTADRWIFQCENQIYCDLEIGNGYSCMVSSHLYPADLVYCHNGLYGLFCGRKTETSHTGKAHGVIDASNLSAVDKMTVEASSTGLVTVAMAFSRCDPTFAIVKLDCELVAYGETRHICWKLESRVSQICFFNAVCYLALDDGRVLRSAELLKES